MDKFETYNGREKNKGMRAAAFVLCCLTMWSYFSMNVLAESTPVSAPEPKLLTPIDTARYHDYTYIRFINEGDSIDIDDEEFYDAAGRVVFAINKYTLPKNDSLLMELDQTVLPMINSDSLRLVRLVLRGAASPEGPWRWNKFLGNKRAEALLNFLLDRLEVVVTPEMVETDISIEDYRTLCLLMRRAGDKDYGYVQAMCDIYLPQNKVYQLKQVLVKAREGRLWLRLYREYFPKLRTARIMLFFAHDEAHIFESPAEPVAPVPAVKPEEPAKEPEQEPVAEPKTESDSSLVKEPIDEVPALPLSLKRVRGPRREVLSVKSNLLFDFAYVPGYDRWCPIPNVAIEYYPLRGHFTFGASIDFPWWQHYAAHKYFQIRNYQVESRYYFRSGSIDKNPLGEGAAFRGFYVQGYVHGGLYGLCFGPHRGWVGEGFGGGVGAGYVLPLTKKGHWRLEFGAQVGYFGTRYDPYQYENPVDPNYQDGLYYYKWTLAPELFKKRQYRFDWLGPTRIGVTLTYDLLYRRVMRKGVSFRSHEPYNLLSE